MFDKLWKISLVVIAIGLVVGLVTWAVTGEEEREMTPLMEQLAVETIEEFGRKLPRVREIDRVLVLVAGRGGRDEEQQFEEMLLEDLARTGKYHVVTWDEVIDDAGDSLVETFYKKVGMIPGEQPRSLRAATQVVELLETSNWGIDGILVVDVTEFDEGRHRAGLGTRVGLEGTLYSTRAETVVAKVPEADAPKIEHAIESRTDIRYVRHWIGEQHLLLRLLVWFLASACLPWALIGLVRGVVKRKQNQLNLALLAGFTLASALLAWVLLFALGTGAGTVVGLVVVAAAMGYYHFDACDYIERRLL